MVTVYQAAFAAIDRCLAHHLVVGQSVPDVVAIEHRSDIYRPRQF